MYHDLEDIGQDHKSLCATNTLILVIICAKYGKNSSRNVRAVERKQQDVPYFSSFTAKSWPNGIEDISQGQRSLRATHPLMLVIICAKYRTNPSSPIHFVQRKRQDMPYYRIIEILCKVMTEWPWRYRTRSTKLIVRDPPSHASDDLCLILKESMKYLGVKERTRGTLWGV